MIRNKYALIFLSFASTAALSWGDMGHQTVAQIAEQNMTKEAKQFVESILGPEPLLVASIWPDLVRGDRRYADFAPYHFVEIPLGKTYEEKQKIDGFFTLQDAYTIIKDAPTEIKDAKRNKTERAILLRYLTHVIGDVHQPLHVGNGLDMGANLCHVKWKSLRDAKFSQTDLHSLWDEGLVQFIKETVLEGAKLADKRYFGAKEFAEMIVREIPDGADFDGGKVSYEKIQSDTAEKWFEQSQKLHGSIYPDRNKEKNPSERTYCKIVDTDKDGIPIRDPRQRLVVIDGNYDASTLPELDKVYAEKATPVIKLQILKAGLRLARVLNEIGKGFKSTDNFEKHIEAALLKNSAQ